MFNNLEKVNVGAKGDKKIKSYKVYNANKNSTVHELPELFLAEVKVPSEIASARNLVSYEGIVTGTNESTSGIYVLDKKVKIVLSHICLVSNIPIFEKGQKIKVTNAHFEQLSETLRVLWACAKTVVTRVNNELSVRYEDTRLKLYNKEEYMKQKVDPILNLCHDWSLSVREVICLSDIYQNSYLVKFKSIFTDGILNTIEHFIAVLQLCGWKCIGTTSSRCLITEFLSVPHECGLWGQEKMNSEVINRIKDLKYRLITLTELKAFIRKQVDKRKETQKNKYKKISLQYDYCEISDSDIMDDINYFLHKKFDNLHEDQNDLSISSFSIIGLLEVDVKTG